MRDLERSELLAVEPRSRFADEVEYHFRHALVRDAAYAMLTDEDRTLGHALAADWLSSRVDDGALLAHHFATGNRPNAAAKWYVRAAEQALAAHDFDALSRHRGRAIECGAGPEVLAPAWLAEAEAQLWLGDNASAANAAEVAAVALERGAEKWFVALGVGASALGKLGRVDRLLRLVEELEQAPATNEHSGRARAIARASMATQLVLCGELARGDALLDGCEQEPGAAGDAGVLARVLDAASERGHAAGEPLSPDVRRRARELFLRIGDRRSAHAQSASEIVLLTTIGAVDEAVGVAEALLRDSGGASARLTAFLHMARASAARTRGDIEPFLELTTKLDAANNPRMAGAMHLLSAQSLVTFGRIDEAARYVERARSFPNPMPAHEAVALAILARIEVARGRAADALIACERAFALVAVHRFPIMGASTLAISHFEALHALGRHEEARAALRAGVAAIDRGAAKLETYASVYIERGWDNRHLMELAKKHGA
jgi:tetratricopeptide (TPR) repeat protein